MNDIQPYQFEPKGTCKRKMIKNGKKLMLRRHYNPRQARERICDVRAFQFSLPNLYTKKIIQIQTHLLNILWKLQYGLIRKIHIGQICLIAINNVTVTTTNK